MDTLTRMRAFIDVVEAEGFSAAGRKIGRSKALLSKYVRELEDELGAALFERSRRGVELTEAGQRFFPHAVAILRQLVRLGNNLNQIAREANRSRLRLLEAPGPRAVEHHGVDVAASGGAQRAVERARGRDGDVADHRHHRHAPVGPGGRGAIAAVRAERVVHVRRLCEMRAR